MYTHLYTGLLCNTCLITVDLVTIILHTLLHVFCIITLCLQVTPPESVTPRWAHSITATSLGPGLTEVLVFGGMLENRRTVAETTILRFGEQLLVHVAMATHCLIDKYTIHVSMTLNAYTCYMCSLIPYRVDWTLSVCCWTLGWEVGSRGCGPQ